MQAEKMIKQYPEWKKELTVIRNQLCSCNGVALTDVINCMCFSRSEGERVQTSGVPDITAQTALAYQNEAIRLNDERTLYLLQRYQLLAEEVEFFEQTVQSLSGKLPGTMYDLVIEPISWKAVSEKHNMSMSMIGKHRKRALKEMDIAYEMRDRHIESYILS